MFLLSCWPCQSDPGAAHSQPTAGQFLLQVTPVQTGCFQITPQAPAVQADYFQPAPHSHLGDLISPDKIAKRRLWPLFNFLALYDVWGEVKREFFSNHIISLLGWQLDKSSFIFVNCENFTQTRWYNKPGALQSLFSSYKQSFLRYKLCGLCCVCKLHKSQMLGGGEYLNQQATVAEIENVGKVRLCYRVFAYATHTHK